MQVKMGKRRIQFEAGGFTFDLDVSKNWRVVVNDYFSKVEILPVNLIGERS